MHCSSGRSLTETLWYRDHVPRWPISADRLVDLIELGWSDYRIGSYFCVEPKKVSALRAYYGLILQAQHSWVWRLRRRKRLADEQ
jgi:hypothetical protein